MSVKRTYSCDLCHDDYDPLSERLIGLYWETNKAESLKLVYSRYSEHHICLNCFTALRHAQLPKGEA